MERFIFYGGRVGAFCFSLGIFLLLSCVNAENRTDPTANVNIGPIQQWRSAYLCLQNIATEAPCAGWGPNKGIITPQGKLNVSSQDLPTYCEPTNCANHIRTRVLSCIYLVHRHFLFANNGTVKSLNETLAHVCANLSPGQELIIGQLNRQNSGLKAYQKVSVSLLSGLLVFLAIFKIL